MGRKKSLTKEEVLKAIRNWLIHYGIAPTVEELRRILGVGSSRTVLRYLQWLEKEGDIERWPGARGLKLLRSPRKGLETVPVPLVGQVPAGPLMTAEENIEGWLRLPKENLKPRSAKFFLLRVRGDSMNKAVVAGSRIENGDLIVVRQQPTAEPGEIVVVVIDGEATVKRLERGPNYFILRPQSTNPDYQPIVTGRDFTVAGVVCGILKKGSDLIVEDRHS
jgi:repressor LexA